MTLLTFRHRSGAAEFTCTCCGRLVMIIAPPDDQPACLTCRFIESEIPEHERAAVREFLRGAGRHIAINLPFPAEVLAQHTAILGKTGSGKTSTGKLIVEHVVETGARVCVLDPIKSDWWGLTSSADGTRPGLPFHILGGPRGHVPLHSSAGKAVGEIVATGALPLSIVDMADFEAGGLQRFFIDFADALTKKMRGVLYLVVEEAHEFAPKERAGIGQENLAVHWAKKLATAGRSKGIRLIVATQRVQALHNAVLGSCETMIVHRLTAPADQEPVLKWLKANAEKSIGEQIAGSLASLRTGTGWACSGEARIFRPCDFPRISTYDNTATPTDNDTRQEVTTAPVDKEKLRAIVGAAVEEAKANDPAELKKRIAELEGQLGASNRGKECKPADAAALERAREEGRFEGYKRGKIDGYRDGVRSFGSVLPMMREAARIGDIARDFVASAEKWIAETAPAETPAAIADEARGRGEMIAVPEIDIRAPIPAAAAPPAPKLRQKRAPTAADGSLQSGARAMLAVLARNHPRAFSWEHTATMAGILAGNGYFYRGKKELIERGLASEDAQGAIATQVGRKLAAVDKGPVAPLEIVALWTAKLSAAAPAMLEYLFRNQRPVPVNELAAAIGVKPGNGYWYRGVKALKNAGLVEQGSSGGPLNVGWLLQGKR